MFKRFTLHLALIFLFAFTQIGLTTHETSHFEDLSKHSRQDQNSHAEQCAQCISYAEVSSGLQSQTFALPVINSNFIAASSYLFSFQPSLNTSYSARAPPQIA